MQMVGEGALPVTLDRVRSERDSLQIHFSHACLEALEGMALHVDVSFAFCRFRACCRPLGRVRARVGFAAKSAVTWTYRRITGHVPG